MTLSERLGPLPQTFRDFSDCDVYNVIPDVEVINELSKAVEIAIEEYSKELKP